MCIQFKIICQLRVAARLKLCSYDCGLVIRPVRIAPRPKAWPTTLQHVPFSLVTCPLVVSQFIQLGNFVALKKICSERDGNVSWGQQKHFLSPRLGGHVANLSLPCLALPSKRRRIQCRMRHISVYSHSFITWFTQPFANSNNNNNNNPAAFCSQ